MNDRQWTGVVLVGGQSSRMGRDKALIEVDGVRMLDRAVELLRPHAREVLVIGDPLKYAKEHAVTIADETPGMGPLGGLVTALKRARYVRLLVIACDLPRINDRLLTKLKHELIGEVDAVIPKHDAFVEPLAAAYHRHCVDTFERHVNTDRLKLSDALDAVNTRYLPIPLGNEGWPTDLFKNLNAPADL